MYYEKKYKEALERARQFSEHPLQEDSSGIVEYIFPELKESEDKRIRKWIIGVLSTYEHDIDLRNAAIDWLEKQDEKIQYWEPSEEQLDALDYAYNSCPDTERGNYYEGVLGTIIDDLHKLSEKQGEQKPSVVEFKAKDWYVSKVDGKIRNIYHSDDKSTEKPAWSEEDEYRAIDAICLLENAKEQYASTIKIEACIDWLKSIKKRLKEG